MFKKYFFKDLIYIIKYRILGVRPRTDGRKSKGYILIIIFFVLIYLGYSTFEARIRPTVVTLAEARAKIIATDTINNAINEEIVKNIKFEDLVTLSKDSNDKITALQMNIVKMNEIQALTSQLIQDKLSKIDSNDLMIPLGNILNSTILAGWGPKIKIQIMPVGTVQSEFRDDSVTSGINQTKHRIVLDIKERVFIVVPLVSTYSEVSTTIPIAETIIVGDVPSTFLDVSGASSEEIQKARTIAPSLSADK